MILVNKVLRSGWWYIGSWEVYIRRVEVYEDVGGSMKVYVRGKRVEILELWFCNNGVGGEGKVRIIDEGK